MYSIVYKTLNFTMISAEVKALLLSVRRGSLEVHIFCETLLLGTVELSYDEY